MGGEGGLISIPEYLHLTFGDYSNISIQSVPALKWPGLIQQNYEYHDLVRAIPHYCDSLFETVTVLTNGDVVPCCYDIGGDFVLGNVLNNSIFDIWNDDNYVKLRKSIINGKPYGICAKCPVITSKYIIK